MYFTNLTGPEIQRILDNANLDEAERKIFELRLREQSIVYIAQNLNMSTASISRKIKKIKLKTDRL